MKVEFSEQELNVLVTLMQIGVKGCQGPQFDEAVMSYGVLRQRIVAAIEASKAEPVKPHAPDLHVVSGDVAE